MNNVKAVQGRRVWLQDAKIFAFLLSMMLLGSTCMAMAQNAPVAPPLESTETSGPHAVGLKVVNQYDYSRNYRFSTDELGEPFRGERARPVQTLIWYPAEKSKAKPMTVADYLHFLTTNARYDKLDGEKEEAQSRKEMASRLATPMWAVSNAPVEAGRFPIVIYAPGMDDDAWENASLCEYLASYGYVVLASPSTAVHGRFMDGDVAAGNALARDIVFLLDYAQRLPDTDRSEVAVVGYSYGGLAGLFAAARDIRVKALVTMDGTMRFAPDLMKQAGDVHPEQMTIPLLFFGGVHRPAPAGDLKGEQGTDNVLYAWKHGDVTTAWMRQMKHGNFPSIDHGSTSIAPDANTHEREIITGQAWVARYTREFLDVHLKQDAAAKGFLKKTPEENGVPVSVMTMTFRAAQGPAPTLEGFRAELGREGFEHARDIYAALHQEYPDFKLEESRFLNAWVYFLMNDNPTKALGLLKAYLLACPNSREVYYLFGQAYEKAEQKPSAMENYKEALRIEPGFRPAQEKLKAMKSNPTSAE
jgi:pimeloyl-ACP methyl ester carboxylesterase